MVYYIILMLFYWVLSINEINGSLKVKRRTLYTFSLLLPMCCLVAFRSVNIGNDTSTYYHVYQYISQLSSYKHFYENMGRMEFGYTNLSFFLSRLGCSFFMFQILVAFFTFYSFGRFIYRYTPYIGVSCFIIACGVMYSAMNVMRMELAIAILLFSIPFIQKKQWVRFLIVVFIAFLFHKSAMIFLIMYPLSVLKHNRIITILIVLSAVIIAALGVTFFQFITSELEMYENYTEGEYFSEDRSLTAVTIGFIETLLTLSLFYWTGYFKQPQYNANEIKINRQITFAYISRMAYWIVFAFAILSFTNNIMSRVSSYFSILTMAMIPYSIKCLSGKDPKILLFTIVSFVLASERIVIWIFRPGWNHIIPYEWGF